MSRIIFKRGLHFFIDAFIIFIIFIIVIILTTTIEPFINLNKYLVYFIIWVLYYFISEYFFNKTIGKIITGTKVVVSKSKKDNYITFLVRTISRLIPLEPFSIFIDEKKIMWHDKISGTMVIDK